MKSVLFVCHGNICRSPMAEYILKYLTDNKIRIESRSTSLEEIGNDIYPPIKNVLDKNHIPYFKHSAKQITIDDYNDFDIIVCFDKYNLSNLKRMLPDISKVIKLNDSEIDDPWYTEEFDKCFKEIYDGCINLKEKVL